MLQPDEYTTGRTVRNPNGGDEFDVTGFFQDGYGSRYLIAQHHETPGIGVLLSEAAVRDEWEARDPEEVKKEREAAVTDATDATDGPPPTPANP